MKSCVIPLTEGRMGNFLFQAAAALAYAWDHDLNVTLPNVSAQPGKYPVYLQHLRDEQIPKMSAVTIKESGFHHQHLPFQEDWKTDKQIILDGYWQSEKYFKHHRERIINAFAYPWKSKPGWVSVHVRRGDYLRWKKKHPPVPAAWIFQAMAEFPGYKFRFFSDDIAWCKATFGFRDDCSFAAADEVNDLIEMSWCEHHICSCSTFSWWAAWLNQNPNKRIIMPKLWFVPGWNGFDVKDVVPTQWERL